MVCVLLLTFFNVNRVTVCNSSFEFAIYEGRRTVFSDETFHMPEIVNDKINSEFFELFII
jgi:hypothetical protein